MSARVHLTQNPIMHWLLLLRLLVQGHLRKPSCTWVQGSRPLASELRLSSQVKDGLKGHCGMVLKMLQRNPAKRPAMSEVVRHWTQQHSTESIIGGGRTAWPCTHAHVQHEHHTMIQSEHQGFLDAAGKYPIVMGNLGIYPPFQGVQLQDCNCGI